MQEERTGIGSKYILSHNGLPINPSTIQNRITKYAKLAGVKRIQLKDLGHSSPEITYRHYAHLKRGADAALAQKMAGQITH